MKEIADREDRRSASADPEIVRGLQAREEAALSALVSRYGARIFTLCSQMLSRPEEAEEAVQDVFLTAWQRASGFRGESSLYTWLYGIAVHKCLQKRRGAGRWRAALARLADFAGWGPTYRAAGGLPKEVPTPEALAERQERSELTQKALETITEEYRAALLLRDWDGMSYEEIGAATGVGVGTVKSRIRRGRLALATALRRLEGHQ